jgi:rubredoxin
MIYKKYDYTLELTCDKCGRKKQWRNNIYNGNCGMKINVMFAKKDGWKIIKTSCCCPYCKLNKSAKLE